jgi:hypothetical protein
VQREKRMWQPHRPQGKRWAKRWSVNMDYTYSVRYKLILMLIMLADPEPPGVTDYTSNKVMAASASEDGWVQVAETLFPYFADRAQMLHVCLCVRAPYRCHGAAMNVKFTGQCLYSSSTSPLANIRTMSGFAYHMSPSDTYISSVTTSPVKGPRFKVFLG